MMIKNQNLFFKQCFKIAIVLLTIFFSKPTLAEESYSKTDLFKNILSQSPNTMKYLTSTLDIEESGEAIRIGNNINPNLGGTSIGPYTFAAKPKGSSAPYIFTLVVHTKPHFYDSKKKSSDIAHAKTVNEVFESIELKPLK